MGSSSANRRGLNAPLKAALPISTVRHTGSSPMAGPHMLPPRCCCPTLQPEGSQRGRRQSRAGWKRQEGRMGTNGHPGGHTVGDPPAQGCAQQHTAHTARSAFPPRRAPSGAGAGFVSQPPCWVCRLLCSPLSDCNNKSSPSIKPTRVSLAVGAGCQERARLALIDGPQHLPKSQPARVLLPPEEPQPGDKRVSGPKSLWGEPGKALSWVLAAGN